jgi:uncharacterized membrane protein YjjB (DUF3815 family)
MWLPMLISSASGYITLLVLSDISRGDSLVISLPTIAAAFAVGVVSNLYARYCRDIAVGPMLSGILSLVPGSLAVKGGLEFETKNTSVGINFVHEMLVVSASITVGLLASSIVVFPMRKNKKRHYMAY